MLTVKERLRESITNLFSQGGFDVETRVVTTYIEEVLKGISVLIPPEYVYVPEDKFEGGTSLNTNIWLLDNKLGWKPIALEDYVLIFKIIPTAIAYLNTQTAVSRWYARKVKELIINGQDVANFFVKHRDFWKQILWDQIQVLQIAYMLV